MIIFAFTYCFAVLTLRKSNGIVLSEYAAEKAAEKGG